MTHAHVTFHSSDDDHMTIPIDLVDPVAREEAARALRAAADDLDPIMDAEVVDDGAVPTCGDELADRLPRPRVRDVAEVLFAFTCAGGYLYLAASEMVHVLVKHVDRRRV